MSKLTLILENTALPSVFCFSLIIFYVLLKKYIKSKLTSLLPLTISNTSSQQQQQQQQPSSSIAAAPSPPANSPSSLTPAPFNPLKTKKSTKKTKEAPIPLVEFPPTAGPSTSSGGGADDMTTSFTNLAEARSGFYQISFENSSDDSL